MNEPPIDIQGLSKRYGTFEAVKDLSLQVKAGELFALLGPNGAGKTTTLRMLMGILQPTAGTACICGLNCFAERVAVKRLVGYLPDEPAFYDYLRGRELLNFVGEMHGLRRDEIAARTGPLIEKLGLQDATEEYAANYSKGMSKKLALICALLPDPHVLILDEPTNGLDPYATRALLEIVRTQAAAGKTVFYSTHLLDQAEKLCSRVAILYQGRLAAIGTLAELRARRTANSTLEEIFFSVTGSPDNGISTPPPPAVNPEPAIIAASAPEAGAPVASVAGPTPAPPERNLAPPPEPAPVPSPSETLPTPDAVASASPSSRRIPRRAPPPQDDGLRIEVRPSTEIEKTDSPAGEER